MRIIGDAVFQCDDDEKNEVLERISINTTVRCTDNKKADVLKSYMGKMFIGMSEAIKNQHKN
jgi:hypothetical protein